MAGLRADRWSAARRALTLSVSLGLCVAFAVTAAGASAGTRAKPVLTFGLETSLSGAIADWGQGQRNTIQLWMQKVNAKGGLRIGGKTYRLKLKVYDNKSDANQD